MRVTSNMMFTAGVNSLQNQQQEMMQVQEQSSTGMRINRPSDDPSGTFRHMLFNTNLTGVQSLKKTSGLASQRLTMGDVKIGNIHENMLQAQDMVMKYAHSSVGGDPDILKLFATEALALYQDVLSVANSELDGVPIFGGGRTDVPFEDSDLKATNVRVQTNGTGMMADSPAWYTSRADVADSGFTPPFDQENSSETTYKISVLAGQYEVDINGVRESSPVAVTEEPGKLPFLDLGNGAIFTLSGLPREGDVFSFGVRPGVDGFKATQVQLQGSGGATSATVGGEFDPSEYAPFIEGANISFKVSVSEGEYKLDVNGVRQTEPLSVIKESGRPTYVDLGNGVTFNIGDIPKEGDIYVFDVESVNEEYKATQAQLYRSGGDKDLTNYYTGFSAHVAEDHSILDVPLSVKITYLASNQEYEINVNGIQQPSVKASTGRPPTLDLGRGLSLDVVGQPQVGDVFYFEVVPGYKGGAEDRPVQVVNGKTLPGNITGSELMEGSGNLGRDVNILGSLAALRGAFLRADPEEVAAQLDRIREGGAQASDFQSITGVRGIQVEATNAILISDEASLQEARANNSEVDLFEIISRLQRVSQALQTMATAERKVLNTSLIDFLS